MSRRKAADDYTHLRAVAVRCGRCRRVLGRLGEGWFQPKRLDAAATTVPQVFTFPGSPRPLLHGRPMKGVTVIPLDGWTLAGVPCGCRKRDGTQMFYTLNLHRMSTASKIDERIHDLVAGMADYGLVGIHDDLERSVAQDVAPGTVEGSGPSDAEIDDLRRRIRNRARRKTWPYVVARDGVKSMLESLVQQDTDDPVDRA